MCESSSTIRVLKFTDTLADVNGVCRFIQNTARSARETGRDLTVFTSTRLGVPGDSNIRNFVPVYARAMPGYATLDLALPPVFEMLRAAEDFDPDVIHISTPGAVGMVGMVAAKMMRVPVVGVYHTDFPAYVDELFDNGLMSWGARILMWAFYRRFAVVLTRSAEYGERLVEMGIDGGRVRRLTAGFDDGQFSPGYRDGSVWDGVGVPREGVKVLFCGRVSTEKNLGVLTEHWGRVRRRIEAGGMRAQLVVVGDGPYREEMEGKLLGEEAYFLGFRGGRELAGLYASSDVFVFPSTTDTLGQVVMEAQASGVAVVATDVGGPKEVIDDGRTGLVRSIEDAGAWMDEVGGLVLETARREAMGVAGVEFMKGFGFGASFEDYWGVHNDAHQRAAGDC